MFKDDILLLTPLTGVSSVMYTFYVEKGITIIPWQASSKQCFASIVYRSQVCYMYVSFVTTQTLYICL